MYILVGLDDIDSYDGGCTTHFATSVVEKIINLNGIVMDYPRLIRLNPDVPWRTRGNGAVALEAYIPKKNLIYLLNWIRRYLDYYLELEDGFRVETQPGILVLNGSKLRRKDYIMLYNFSRNALYKVVPQNVLRKIISSLRDKIIYLFNSYGRRGLIGALAAIGNYLPNDHTYELLVYRKINEKNRDRNIQVEPDISYEDENTFAHLDLETAKPIWSPHGPDPVVIGIRGNKICSLLSLFSRIKKYIVFDRWMIFVTNQGTDEHLYACENLHKPVSIYSQFNGFVRIGRKTVKEKGGHIRLEASVDEEYIDLIAYEPSGKLREIVNKLVSDLYVKVGGSLKYSTVERGKIILNIQLMRIDDFSLSIYSNVKPICPRCGGSMESLGSNAGYVCKKCKYHISTSNMELKTDMVKWLPQIILPPYRSIRHLSKPLKRYGREYKHRSKGIRNRVWYGGLEI